MSYILLIHTTLEYAFIALSREDRILSIRKSDIPKEHGSFLHMAISDILREQEVSLQQIVAIGVTNGPGSYTGIRVGLAAAKGLGYALQVPLIACSTLLALAATAIEKEDTEDAVYIPLIHARQAEFYAGFYDQDLKSLANDCIIHTDKINHFPWPRTKHIFFGTGVEKFAAISDGDDIGQVTQVNPMSLSRLIWRLFRENKTSVAAEVKPLYLKDAYITVSKPV